MTVLFSAFVHQSSRKFWDNVATICSFESCCTRLQLSIACFIQKIFYVRVAVKLQSCRKTRKYVFLVPESLGRGYPKFWTCISTRTHEHAAGFGSVTFSD